MAKKKIFSITNVNKTDVITGLDNGHLPSTSDVFILQRKRIIT